MHHHSIPMRIWAAIERLSHPKISTCSCCKRPWHWTDEKASEGIIPVSTMYSHNAGCFTICASCWEHLSPDERFDMYEARFSKRPEWPDIAEALYQQMGAPA